MSTVSTVSTATEPRPRSTSALRWGALASIACLLLTVGLLGLRAEPLPRYGRLPAFTFTRQDGQPFGLEQLQGRPWVANFIFTRCPIICPGFTRKMARVQKQTAGGPLALVSFSVDPQYDTPERLTAYAAKHGADPARWSFLTGDYTRLQDIVVGGFKVAMGRTSEDADADDIPNIFHGSHFVLVDRTGEIRGYYNGEHEDAMERLVRDAARLVRSGE